MSAQVFPWMQPQLAALLAGGPLPHALLLRGPQGIGKRDFARALAQSLLCATPAPGGLACGECQSCRWFVQPGEKDEQDTGAPAHPDYREVVPEALSADAADGDDKDKEKGEKRKPSAEIRIEDIRELQDFISLSSHQGRGRVTVVYPAEAMNANAANALLKNLEEPPPGMHFLLVSHRPERLLPTILSRCRQVALAGPDAATAHAWLKTQGIKEELVLLSLAQSGQAPLAALELARQAGSAGEWWGERKALLDGMAVGARGAELFDALGLAERLRECPPPRLLNWLQRWAHDLMLAEAGGAPRYNPDYAQAVAATAARIPAAARARYYRALTREQRVANHPLNARLALERLLLSYAALLRGADDFRDLDRVLENPETEGMF